MGHEDTLDVILRKGEKIIIMISMCVCVDSCIQIEVFFFSLTCCIFLCGCICVCVCVRVHASLLPTLPLGRTSRALSLSFKRERLPTESCKCWRTARWESLPVWRETIFEYEYPSWRDGLEFSSRTTLSFMPANRYPGTHSPEHHATMNWLREIFTVLPWRTSKLNCLVNTFV